MTEILQHWLAPVAAVVLTLWAGWIAVAAEAEADLPRMLEGQLKSGAGRLTIARSLHIVHLLLLVLAAATTGTAVGWWGQAPVEQGLGLALAVGLVWVVGDLLPRIIASIEPGITGPARRLAVRTLPPFSPLFRIVSWADANWRSADGPSEHERLVAAEREMVLGLFSLAETTVAEVMTPRIDIVAVDASSTY